MKHTVAQYRLVVSPGGSVIYRQQAMDHLKNMSKIFYLNVPLEVLEERIADVPRGIVNAKNKTFADLYVERTPLYAKFADHTLNGNADPDSVVNEILLVVDPSTSDDAKKIR